MMPLHCSAQRICTEVRDRGIVKLIDGQVVKMIRKLAISDGRPWWKENTPATSGRRSVVKPVQEPLILGKW